MHVFIIISAALVAIGLAVGLICQFLAGGYFNYGNEYSNYKSVVVKYAIVDLHGYGEQDGIKKLCDEEFSAAGLKYYSHTVGTNADGGEFVFMFSENADGEVLTKAATSITARLNAGTDGFVPSKLSGAYFNEVKALKGGERAYIYGAIALASAIAFQFLYFLIRYRVTMALASLLADIHSIAIYVSLVAITRVPVGASVFAFGALTVLATMICSWVLFGRMKKNFKDEKYAKLTAYENVDMSAAENVKTTVYISSAIALFAVVAFVLLSLGSMSAYLTLTPAVLGLISAATCVYGEAFFIPSVYSRFKVLGDKFKKTKPVKPAAATTEKETEKDTDKTAKAEDKE